MFLSVFDMFKVGVGPSSSHTMGPMVAGARFLDLLRVSPFQAHGLRASLHGSLAFTGKGHATDRATILGLAGFVPDSYDHEKAEAILKAIHDGGTVSPPGLRPLNRANCYERGDLLGLHNVDVFPGTRRRLALRTQRFPCAHSRFFCPLRCHR